MDGLLDISLRSARGGGHGRIHSANMPHKENLFKYYCDAFTVRLIWGYH